MTPFSDSIAEISEGYRTAIDSYAKTVEGYKEVVAGLQRDIDHKDQALREMAGFLWSAMSSLGLKKVTVPAKAPEGMWLSWTPGGDEVTIRAAIVDPNPITFSMP